MVIPVALNQHQAADTTAGMRPPPMFHNVATAPPTGYTVPMAPQVRITPYTLFKFINVGIFLNLKFFFHSCYAYNRPQYSMLAQDSMERLRLYHLLHLVIWQMQHKLQPCKANR